MKQIIIFSLLCMSIFSCKKNTFNYKINGAAQGVPDGAKIYLKHLNQNGRELIRDSGVVTDEEFKMNGNIVEPTIHFMSSDKIPGQLIFMLENSVIDINLNNKNLMASKVKGSESNDGFVLFQAGMDSIREQSRNVVLKLRSGGLSSDRKKDSLLKLLEKSSIGMQEYPLKYVEKYNNSYFSLNLISLESNKNNFDIIRFHKAFENLNSKLKNSPKGLKTKRKLDSLMLIIEKK